MSQPYDVGVIGNAVVSKEFGNFLDQDGFSHVILEGLAIVSFGLLFPTFGIWENPDPGISTSWTKENTSLTTTWTKT